MALVSLGRNNDGGDAPTSIDVTLSVADGLRIMAFLTIGEQTAAVPPTVPSGFSLIESANATLQSSGKLGVTYCYEKKVAASEPGTYTWGGYGAGVNMMASMISLSGRHASIAATIVGTSDPGNAASPASAIIDGVTAAAGDDILAVHCISWLNYTGVTTGTPPSGFTQRNEESCGDGAFGQYVSSLDAASVGATGSLTAVLTNAGERGEYFGIVVAVPVAAAAFTGVPRILPQLNRRSTGRYR
jgi:hypothetical protein